MRALYLVVAGIAAASTCLFGSEEKSQVTRPVPFALQLAASGIPVGVVGAEDEIGENSQRADQRTAVNPHGRVSEVVAEFNRSNPSFRAAAIGQAVHVRAVSEPAAVRELLTKRIFVEAEDGVSVQNAVFVRVLGLMAGKEPQGYIGLGPVGAEAQPCPMDALVRIGGEQTIESLLDSIVGQVPGLIWVVTYQPSAPADTMSLGLACPGGVGQLMTVKF